MWNFTDNLSKNSKEKNLKILNSNLKSVKTEYGYTDAELDSPDRLFMQICIFENQAHDNFADMDSQIENIVGFWDGS